MGVQEPARLSSVILFKRNISDPVVLISTSVIYLLCNIILPKHTTSPTFLVIFAISCWLFNYHLESYRSFRIVSKCSRSLESRGDQQALRDFLSTHLRYIKPNFVFEHPTSPAPGTESTVQATETFAKTAKQRDTYRWINKVILFFWPYLSHVVHHQLNEFLSKSSALSRSDTGLKRLLYAFIRQIDANILSIEHCELGSNAPYIKGIHVLDKLGQEPGMANSSNNKSLVYDLDLVYEGNMNIAFVCRYFCCCSSRLGLKDVFVKLSSRVVVGPIDSAVPSIEKIDYSLLELPKFGYKGIALVELAELKIARRSINRLIKDHLLYPKSISLKLADMMQMMHDKQKEAAASEAERVDLDVDGAECSEIHYANKLPWTTRCLAQLMFCTCMCSNFCLRCCQQERQNPHSLGADRSPIQAR